ncbi:hypothetical protein [Pseudomonas fulva]|uniref:hypothetical protein n=1 Tax=Pseudomonas fulva TaxID=47880 RepID=UPI002DBD5446|nr:hypothetical protein [Pseudomonas fulva]MEB8055776.1 hypothetical protein [Pseudomonas fulva]
MHRTATFVDIKIDSHGISRSNDNPIIFDADPKSMEALSQQMLKLWNGGNRFVKKGRSEKAARLYLADLEVKDNRLILLINRSDPTAPDSVSSDPDNKSRVVHRKPANHGSEYSAHVVIGIHPTVGDNYYLCIIETVFGSGLHLSSISDYLKSVIKFLRMQFKDEYLIPHAAGVKDKKGDPVMVRHVHTLELQGHPSSSFQTDLETGTLSGIDLINFSGSGATWDDKGTITEHQRIVQLKPASGLVGSAGSALRQVRAKVSKTHTEYQHMRVRFKTESGESKDATINSDTGKLVDLDKYIKRHTIPSPISDTTSFDKINQSIIKSIIALMV